MPFNSNVKLQLFNSAATQKRQELENVTSKMANASVPLYPTGTFRSRVERRRDVEVNSAANVKTVARLKSMGDGGSS